MKKAVLYDDATVAYFVDENEFKKLDPNIQKLGVDVLNDIEKGDAVLEYDFDKKEAYERTDVGELHDLLDKAREQLIYDKAYEMATPKQKIALTREKNKRERRQAWLEKRREEPCSM